MIDQDHTNDVADRAVIRCLIVDDEAPARDELRYLLQDIEGVLVVGAAANAEEAELLIGAVDYDIVFLDIRMPGRSGLDLAKRLATRPNPPGIVFTTAYPDHAVDAFELSAVDYLLKPFDGTRLNQALARVNANRLDRSGSEEPHQPSTGAAAEPSRRLPIHRGERTVFVDESDVVAASAARGYCYLTLRSERVLVNYTLAELEERLSSRIFRVHRSHLVNLDCVAELRSDYRGSLVLVMDDAAKSIVPVSRRHGPELRRRLGM